MLKIWLTWLQPSLGLLGAALILLSPFAAYAEIKPANTSAKKSLAQSTQWSSIRTNGTRIDRELSAEVAMTPDQAVRQIAIGTLNTGTIQPPTSLAKTAPVARIPNPKTTIVAQATPLPKAAQKLKTNTLANFNMPAAKKVQKLSKIAPKAGKVNEVAAALARASQPSALVPVPGLYIGNSDVKLSQKVAPAPKPLAGAIASSQIGAPTPLSAMMGAKAPGVDPFPVVRPEMMSKLPGAAIPTAKAPATKTAPKSLDPIANIPSSQPNQSVATKPATDLKAVAPNSLDPIANIPNGLQQILGNDLNTRTATVANKPAPKSTLLAKVDPMAALKQVVSDETATSASVTTASLQLATAQSYNAPAPKFSMPGESMLMTKSATTNVATPKFNIPGETIVAAKPAKPITSVLVAKAVRKPFVPANLRQNGYMQIASSERLMPIVNTSWTGADTRHNLGGLILGSPQTAIAPKYMLGTSVVNGLTRPTSKGLVTRTAADIY